MSRTFAYVRVSTGGQTTENQARELGAAGFDILRSRLVAETISGSVAAMMRPGFAKLVDRLEPGDILVVTKLDRLGRNAMDVRQTVERLASLGVKVKCLALGDTDLTSPGGKMIMQVMSAFAEFERDLLVERTLSGQDRARAQGKKFGRPPVLDASGERAVVAMLAEGQAKASIARKLGISRRTVDRVGLRAPQPIHS